ncbi:glycosyltransferase 61 family protein [Azospirillum sp. B2RO_4]|uniref:glycosyltransferase 61 family protein n=1 Tax=Azospirillum sp. B2RO_4 TaxID=3027796 RepID=UPI003DA90680
MAHEQDSAAPNARSGDAMPPPPACPPASLTDRIAGLLLELEAWRQAGTPAGRRFESAIPQLAAHRLPLPADGEAPFQDRLAARLADPQDLPGLLPLLAKLAFDTGFTECARSCLEAAARLSPSGDILLELGRIVERQDGPGPALAIHKQALKADPSSMAALLGICRAFGAAKDTDALIGLGSAMIGAGIDDPELHALMARSLAAAGRGGEAIDHLDRARSRFPGNDGLEAVRLDCLPPGSQAWTDAIFATLQHKSGLDSQHAVALLTRHLVDQGAAFPASDLMLPEALAEGTPARLVIRFNHEAPADGSRVDIDGIAAAGAGPDAPVWYRSWLGPPSLHRLEPPANLDRTAGGTFTAHARTHSPNYAADTAEARERLAARGVPVAEETGFPHWYGSGGRRLYDIPGAHLFDLSLLDRNGAFLHGFSYPDQLFGGGSVLMRRTEAGTCQAFLPLSGPPLRHKGKAQLLSASFHNNVYHWLIDDLPRLQAYGAGPFGRNGDPLLLNARLAQVPFVRETIAALGIGGQIATYPADRLVAVDHLQAAPGFERGYAPEDAAAFRDCLLRAFGAPTRHPGDRIIYVSRFDAASRRETNEAEVRHFMESIGALCVSASELAMEQRAQLFSRARLLIGANGAGMTNMLFCPPGTPVIEVAPTFPHPCYWLLASALGLPYHVLISGFPQENLNFQVDLGALRRLVTDLL